MNDAGPRRRLVAILAADAAGYSRLMGADEQATVAALERARTIFREQTEAHRGRIVDTAGDSVLAVFETARGAADAALQIQRRLAASQTGVAPARRMDFRLGVHLGDVIEQGDGSVYGNGVNIAARLQALAAPGEVWVSAAVRGALGTDRDRAFDDRGPHAVKNIAEPVHAFVLRAPAAGAAAPQGLRAPAPARVGRRTVGIVGGTAALAGLAVVLLSSWSHTAWFGSPVRTGPAVELKPMSLALGPVTAPADDAAGAEASERLARDLAAGLAGPCCRNAVTLFALAPDPAAPAAMSAQARALGARYLLHGVTRRQDGRHQTSLQIDDTASGAPRWSVLVPAEEDATPVEHALGIRRLVGQIANVLYGEEGRRVLAAPVAQLGPLELAVRSWAVYYAAPTLAGIDEGLRLADIALASDPNSVVALNSKAFLLGNRYDEDAHPDHERYARDLDALSARAVALDPRDVYAWMNRRTALMHAGRWPAALEAVDRAVELDGGSPGTLLEKADLLSYLGRPEAALELLAAEPLRSRHDAVAWAIACHSRLLLGQVADAVGACQKALGGDPSMWYVHLYLAAAQARAGRLDEARASLAVVDRMSPGYTLERLRNHRRYAQPDYRRLAEATYYAGLREAGMPER